MLLGKVKHVTPQGQSWDNWDKRVQKERTKPLATKKISPYKKKKNQPLEEEKLCYLGKVKHITPPRTSLGTIGQKSPKRKNKTFSDEKNQPLEEEKLCYLGK